MQYGCPRSRLWVNSSWFGLEVHILPGLTSGPEKLLCKDAVWKRGTHILLTQSPWKSKHERRRATFVKEPPKWQCFFKLPHRFLASINRLKGLTTPFSPYDIHMSTDPLWHVNFPHWAPSRNEGTSRHQWQNNYMQPQERKGGVSHDELSHLDLWGLLLFTFSIRMEVYMGHEYLLSHNYPSTLPLVTPEPAQGQSMPLQRFLGLSKGPVSSLKSWER